MRNALVGLALATIGLCLSAVRAQDDTAQPQGLEFAAAANLLEKNVKVEGTLFLPDTLDRVRLVVVVMNWGISPAVYEDPEWRRLVTSLGGGLLHARITNIRAISPLRPQLVRQAALGGDAGLLMVLNRLAEESGHEELKDVPMLLWGHSATGVFVATFAGLHPERTVGFIGYHTIRRGIPVNLNIVSRIPALLFSGEKDDQERIDDTEDLLKSGRAIDAPWALVMEPGVTHDSIEGVKKANLLVMPWVRAVVRQRVAPASSNLIALTDRGGWIGNRRTMKIEPYASVSEAATDWSWLPDDASARAWQVVSDSVK